ncbi:MAG TPA: protein kinase [Gemmatimonadales bacterium]|nr:protein kinase [Gemmatimonadales bacterium]
MSDRLDRLRAALSAGYVIERELGRGGMASVYLASDLKHRRSVAVKVLHAELAAALGPDRFLREIEIAARLTHPHILPLHDSGDAAGFVYYVMPYVEGESLRDRLNREKQLPVEDALRIASAVASALAYAHDRDVVHRDVKPENILLSGREAFVADFGIARAITAAAGDRLTATGVTVGTPAYMSPEQAAADPALDGRSDVYSLGCVLYEMLAGQPPFTGPTAESVVRQHLAVPPPPITHIRPAVPAALERVIEQALAKSPADRFATAYQFAEALAAAGRNGRAPTPRGRRSRTLLGGAGALALVTGLGLWAYGRSHAPAAGARRLESLAVLPLDNLSRDSSQAYFVDGMTEALIADLSKIRALRVVSRRSVMRYKAVARPLPEIARELHVDAVIEGSVVQAGDRVRVTVELIDAATDRHMWAETYDRRRPDVLGLQTEVARAVAREVRVAVTPEEQARLAPPRPVNLRAHDAYLLGRYFWNQRTREGLGKAFQHFQQAIKEDPRYAAAYAGLADYYNVLPFYSRTPPREAFPEAKAAAQKALALDDGLAEAHASLAYIKAYYDWDWAGAEREFQRALELNPSYAAAHHSYSRLLAAQGRIDEALAEIRRAEQVEPISMLLKANTAMILFFGRRYDDAIARLRETLEIDSTFDVALWGLGLTYEQKGMYPAAIGALEQAASLSHRDPNVLSSLGHAYAAAGRRAEAAQLADELAKQAQRGYVSSYFFALIYVGEGESDRAVAALSRAAEERSTLLVYLRRDPRFANLHSHAGFQALLGRLHLPGN